MTKMRIDLLEASQAGELLTVRRAAFVTEAQAYGDPHLPALTQTLQELTEDLVRDDVVTVGAWIGPRLVGSIRVELEGQRASLGRLAVVPDLQQRGIGTKLLMAVLDYLPENTSEVWVFTGKDSKHNLSGTIGDPRTEELTYSYLARLTGDAKEDAL